MKKFKTTLIIIATFLCVINVLAQSGQTGKLIWTIEDNKLTISGNGAMPDYGLSDSPWLNYRKSIHTVGIKTNVTSIRNFAFSIVGG